MIKNFYLLDPEGISAYEKNHHLSYEKGYFDIYTITYNEKRIMDLLDTITKELGCNNTITSVYENGVYSNDCEWRNLNDVRKLKLQGSKQIVIENQFNKGEKTIIKPAIYRVYWNENPLISTFIQCISEKNMINLQTLYTYIYGQFNKKILKNMVEYLQNYISCFEISSEPLERKIYTEELKQFEEFVGMKHTLIRDNVWGYKEKADKYYDGSFDEFVRKFCNHWDIAYKNTKVLEKIKQSS